MRIQINIMIVRGYKLLIISEVKQEPKFAAPRAAADDPLWNPDSPPQENRLILDVVLFSMARKG